MDSGEKGRERYFIYKSSRVGNLPYDGPTCKLAGVEGGRIYKTIGEAIRDREKLNMYNPVGFCIRTVYEYDEAN